MQLLVLSTIPEDHHRVDLRNTAPEAARAYLGLGQIDLNPLASSGDHLDVAFQLLLIHASDDANLDPVRLTGIHELCARDVT